MSSNCNHSRSIICAKNISLLFLLHPVPSSPTRNPFTTQKHGTQGYALTLEDDRQLVEALAFLTNDSEDINHIPALCVELCPTRSSLKVWLAVNCARWQSGSQSLRRLKKGFGKVFLTLGKGMHRESRLLTMFLAQQAKQLRVTRNRKRYL